MSRRRPFRVGTLALGLLLVCMPGSALLAQEKQPSSMEEIGRRIEALRPQVDAAQIEAQRADSFYKDSLQAANQIPLDTVYVGPLRIATVPSQADLAKEVFGEVWETFHPLVRGSEHLLTDQLFVFRYGWRFEGIYLEGDKVHSVELSRRWGMESLKEKVRSGLGQALLQALPEDTAGIQPWVGMNPLTPAPDWAWVYRDLASSASVVSRRCFQGNLPWCWEAMGLPAGEGGWKDWYTPEERRLLVESRWGRSLMGERQILTSAHLILHGCLVLESDKACSLVLGEWAGQIPLGTLSRASLVTEALTQGGEGAFFRLIEDPSLSVKERLAHAAGLPADTLVARWRERTLSARPQIHAGLLVSPLSLILWILLLLIFATRSTPWRLG